MGIVLLVLPALEAVAQTNDGDVERTIWDGVYVEAQAERGASIYQANCEICHAANMRGGPGARGVVGLAFQFLWKDKNLGELFNAMRTKMPPGQPGALTDQEYVDVLSVILRGNGLPAATAELPADRAQLDEIFIIWEKPPH
ncbi:MAG: cytochrome c, class I [Gammaproteobacteria bacterium]|nr:cytochrome c, class I [Gammaproteobacteria bacterium]